MDPGARSVSDATLAADPHGSIPHGSVQTQRVNSARRTAHGPVVLFACFVHVLLSGLLDPVPSRLQRRTYCNVLAERYHAEPGGESRLRGDRAHLLQLDTDPAKFNANMSALEQRPRRPRRTISARTTIRTAGPTRPNTARQEHARWQRHGGHQDLRKRATRPPIGTNTCKANFLNR